MRTADLLNLVSIGPVRGGHVLFSSTGGICHRRIEFGDRHRRLHLTNYFGPTCRHFQIVSVAQRIFYFWRYEVSPTGFNNHCRVFSWLYCILLSLGEFPLRSWIAVEKCRSNSEC